MLKIFVFLITMIPLSCSTCFSNDQTAQIDQINNKIEAIKTTIIENPEGVIGDLEKLTRDTYRSIVDKLPDYRHNFKIKKELKKLEDFKIPGRGYSQIGPAPTIELAFKTPKHHLFKKTKTYKVIISALFIGASFLVFVIVALILFGKETSIGCDTR